MMNSPYLAWIDSHYPIISIQLNVFKYWVCESKDIIFVKLHNYHYIIE